MADRWSAARDGITDRRFRAELLDLLERIAIALERNAYPLLVTNAEGEDTPMGAVEEALERQAEAEIHNRDATFCNCGSNASMTCAECTPARLAWVYKIRDEMSS